MVSNKKTDAALYQFRAMRINDRPIRITSGRYDVRTFGFAAMVAYTRLSKLLYPDH